MSTFINDLEYSVRQLHKNPGFTIVAVLTLALGIGANTAIFSVVYSVMIAPLPYPDAEQLVQIDETLPGGQSNGAVSGGAFKDWKEQNSTFAHMAIYENIQRNLTGDGAPQHVSGLMVSSEFLSVLGIKPLIGRDFAAGEDTIGGNNRIMILAHSFWQSRYGADVGIVGRTVYLDQVPYTVIGVLAPNALLQDEALFLVPEVINAPGVNWGRAGHFRGVIGRLLPGTTLSQAQEQLRGIKQQLAEEYPPFKQDWSVALVPMHEIYSSQSRPAFVLLLTTVALVLLIACANVSNLLLARGCARSKEMAIRTAMGASSWRIIQQTLVESLLLALAGCAGGLVLAQFGIRLLGGIVAGTIPRLMYPELNTHVLLFSISVSCACGLLFGILPAWGAIRSDVQHALKDTERGSTSSSRRRLQDLLITSEYAFTLVLLIGAGLLLHSFVRVIRTDPGFNPQQTLAFDLSLTETKYPDTESRRRCIDDLLVRINALSGVDHVGACGSLPLSERDQSEYLSRADEPDRQNYTAGCSFVSGDYFSAMGIKLIRGRLLTESDRREGASRVFVIDRRIADDLFPDQDPIGQSLRLFGQPWEVVGIVAPVRHKTLDADPRSRVYGPERFPPSNIGMVLRTSVPPQTLAKAVRQTILAADPDQPIANLRTLEQAVHHSLRARRATLVLLGLFAGVAICLTSIGIYGVVSYAISQRICEFSIRSALGAQRRDIVRLVFLGSMKPSIIGIGVGLVAALSLACILKSLLFEVKTYDPWVFIGSVCLLGMVAVLSVYFPARRAARVDPMAALRYE